MHARSPDYSSRYPTHTVWLWAPPAAQPGRGSPRKIPGPRNTAAATLASAALAFAARHGPAAAARNSGCGAPYQAPMHSAPGTAPAGAGGAGPEAVHVRMSAGAE